MDDLDNLVKYANNFQIARFMSDGFPFPYTAEKGKAFIGMATGHSDRILYLAIEVDGSAVGGIGVSLQQDVKRKNAELGYWLAEPYWGHGIATQAVKEIVALAFEKFDITRIYASPYSSNPASHRVLEKAGFKLEARIEKNIFKQGEFLDELVYAIRKQGTDQTGHPAS